MVEDMLQMAKLQHGATLEFKYEALNKPNFLVLKLMSSCQAHTLQFAKDSRNVDQRKNDLIMNAMKLESVIRV